MTRVARGAVAGLALAGALAVATASLAQHPQIAGKIEWGLWIDDDGCMHWWADGGAEGYMLDRVNPKTGKPVCLKRSTCMTQNTDVLFDSGSDQLTAPSRAYLARFFTATGAFGYAVYGHTDSTGSDAANLRLSRDRALAVAAVAKSVGAVVDRQIGYGERAPVASNATAAGMQANRRVEIVCYKW